MLIVDTDVLVDVLEDDPDWAEWSIGQLRAQAQIHELVINPVIYAELSLAFATLEALDAVIAEMRLTLAEVPRPALFLAGQAFLRYRRAGGRKSNVLSDFFIGAHAAVVAARCSRATSSGTAPTFPRSISLRPDSHGSRPFASGTRGRRERVRGRPRRDFGPAPCAGTPEACAPIESFTGAGLEREETRPLAGCARLRSRSFYTVAG